MSATLLALLSRVTDEDALLVSPALAADLKGLLGDRLWPHAVQRLLVYTYLDGECVLARAVTLAARSRLVPGFLAEDGARYVWSEERGSVVTRTNLNVASEDREP